MARRSSPHSRAKRPVTPVGYAPPNGYALDIEVYPVAELRRRVGNVEQRGFERVDFHGLLYVTPGSYVHIVDFELLDCMRGSLIVLQPGQVHHFSDLSGCDGWMLMFRSEVLPSRSAGAAKVSEIEAMKQLEELPALVKREFPRWHSVSLYARELGCSEKSLSCATHAIRHVLFACASHQDCAALLARRSRHGPAMGNDRARLKLHRASRHPPAAVQG